MRLICHPTSDPPIRLIPAPAALDWMPESEARAPLDRAGAQGWLVLNAAPLVAHWDGGDGLAAIRIEAETEGDPPAVSELGFGVLTFPIRARFEIDAEVDLWIDGPANRLKDGIQPLAALIATAGGPVSFAMHWRFTRRRHAVAFEIDEPICMIRPAPRGALAPAALA